MYLEYCKLKEKNVKCINKELWDPILKHSRAYWTEKKIRKFKDLLDSIEIKKKKIIKHKIEIN